MLNTSLYRFNKLKENKNVPFLEPNNLELKNLSKQVKSNK